MQTTINIPGNSTIEQVRLTKALQTIATNISLANLEKAAEKCITLGEKKINEKLAIGLKMM